MLQDIGAVATAIAVGLSLLVYVLSSNADRDKEVATLAAEVREDIETFRRMFQRTRQVLFSGHAVIESAWLTSVGVCERAGPSPSTPALLAAFANTQLVLSAATAGWVAARTRRELEAAVAGLTEAHLHLRGRLAIVGSAGTFFENFVTELSSVPTKFLQIVQLSSQRGTLPSADDSTSDTQSWLFSTLQSNMASYIQQYDKAVDYLDTFVGAMCDCILELSDRDIYNWSLTKFPPVSYATFTDELDGRLQSIAHSLKPGRYSELKRLLDDVKAALP